MAKQLPGGRVGRPGKKQTTVCPLTTAQDRNRATQWIRNAIADGKYRLDERCMDYPKNVWYEAEGQIWQGRCINRQSGEYKGWPISETERDRIFNR